MTTFVALYRGTAIGSARLVAVSANPVLAGEIASRMLVEPLVHSALDRVSDPVLDAVESGRRFALGVIRDAAHSQSRHDGEAPDAKGGACDAAV